MQGEEFSFTYFDEDGKSQAEMEADFFAQLTEKYGEEIAKEMYRGPMRMLDSSEREGTNPGYIYVA